MDNFNFTKKEPIIKGWSGDKKYCVTAANGSKYLLRVSPMEQYETKKSEFEMMKHVSALGVSMCHPIELGTCVDGVYSVQSWIDGKDAEDVISLLPDTEQYVYGLEAGKILKKIHSIPAPVGQEDWESRFNRKINRKIKGYTDCPIKFDGSDRMQSARSGGDLCNLGGDSGTTMNFCCPDGVVTFRLVQTTAEISGYYKKLGFEVNDDTFLTISCKLFS